MGRIMATAIYSTISALFFVLSAVAFWGAVTTMKSGLVAIFGIFLIVAIAAFFAAEHCYNFKAK